MDKRMRLAQQIDGRTFDKVDAIFGYMLVCADADVAERTALHLRSQGIACDHSRRLNTDRVFFL
ncbi:hypothetical protein [Embleya sp. NPDC059237]|uniref:hypothetical protein n=1 Tax=Embleya sp. NPDC059237 TaxID=3346784 RepID=UPI0036840AC9